MKPYISMLMYLMMVSCNGLELWGFFKTNPVKHPEEVTYDIWKEAKNGDFMTYPPHTQHEIQAAYIRNQPFLRIQYEMKNQQNQPFTIAYEIQFDRYGPEKHYQYSLRPKSGDIDNWDYDINLAITEGDNRKRRPVMHNLHEEQARSLPKREFPFCDSATPEEDAKKRPLCMRPCQQGASNAGRNRYYCHAANGEHYVPTSTVSTMQMHPLEALMDAREDVVGRPKCIPSEPCTDKVDFVDMKFSAGFECRRDGRECESMGMGSCWFDKGACQKTPSHECSCKDRNQPTKTLQQISDEANARIQQHRI